eukprot:m.122341 g.122341  ORF g.122341 m.122341 type:complete len:100 (-) comp23328_c2_seq3:836-1135(-)
MWQPDKRVLLDCWKVVVCLRVWEEEGEGTHKLSLSLFFFLSCLLSFFSLAVHVASASARACSHLCVVSSLLPLVKCPLSPSPNLPSSSSINSHTQQPCT